MKIYRYRIDRSLLAVLVAVGSSFILFQNCGPGFSARPADSQSLDSISSTPDDTLDTDQTTDSPAGAFKPVASLFIRRATNSYLERNLGPDGSRTQWTFSAWIQRTSPSVSGEHLFSRMLNANNISSIYFSPSGRITLINYANGMTANRIATATTYNEMGRWNHILVASDTSHPQESERLIIFVNGERVTNLTADSVPAARNYAGLLNSSGRHSIGDRGFSVNDGLDAMISEVHFIDGAVLAPMAFGVRASDGSWRPIRAVVPTYGANGFYLPFDSMDVGRDASGANHSWTPVRLTSSDLSPLVP
ncbi:MAG: LamG domain-containing protein [Bdellovibrionaceae bacterium]|nr:LamG domain-containing protein [Pseudobdellovibrionaceae bacterium]